MLSREENELLTQTRPGTLMGEFIRRYWVPALLSEEIPIPDCPPVRVRLLGEDLVAFRDTNGRVGLLGEHCSHRGTSLFYGRNEECGLRCIYHGWKYDIDGNVLDNPAEPAGSTLNTKVHHKAYTCREAAGVVFAYLGPKAKIPLFPTYEWLITPAEQVNIEKYYEECNYLQCLEGEFDSAHLNFLHRGYIQQRPPLPRLRSPDVLLNDNAPTYDNEWMSYGVRSACIRKVDRNTNYIRVNLFVSPIIGVVPVADFVNEQLDGSMSVYMVPIDDTHTWRYNFCYNRTVPISDEERAAWRKEVGPGYKRLANLRNNYLQDREWQKATSHTGIKGFGTNDACVTESMGPIYDRTTEHLGVSDSFVIQARRFLINALRKFELGTEPPGLIFDARENNFVGVRSEMFLLPPAVSWKGIRDTANKSAEGI